MDVTVPTFESTYFCPICGIALHKSDFERPSGEYFCPYCCSQQTPALAKGRAGWGSPD